MPHHLTVLSQSFEKFSRSKYSTSNSLANLNQASLGPYSRFPPGLWSHCTASILWFLLACPLAPFGSSSGSCWRTVLWLPSAYPLVPVGLSSGSLWPILHDLSLVISLEFIVVPALVRGPPPGLLSYL